MDKIGSVANSFRIGIVPVPGFALLSYSCTVEPFRAANLLGRGDLYKVSHFSHAGTVQSSGAAEISKDMQIGEEPDLDLLLVIAGGDPMSLRDPALFRWLGRMARRGVTLGGVSGGPAILARAGLMQDRRMTVHWEHAPALTEVDPNLMIERRLYVIDRDRVTCGGGTAPLDLAHALITKHHGALFARLVSDWFLHTDVRPAADPQRGGLVERVGTTAPPVLNAVAAMEDHIADPLSLDELADLAGVTPRQLNRVFREKTGESTMRYYRQLRLETGHNLLRNSSLSLTNIAFATGFASSSNFTRAFADLYGAPPSRFRR
ncbi:GlxA family transcriptional regulator [Primorskyibacter sp. S87]|uniref:GlxA family transcriptional regulator n=1 Tax=Primorskyibacter sp. S87 TaxID=3415126 RepID=UPI003C7DDB51